MGIKTCYNPFLMTADLHIHTNFSDGIFSPEDVIKKAHEAGLTSIAITDHDTVDGIDRAIAEGKKFNINVIPGIEFTTDIPGTEIHILGYYVDHNSKWLRELLSSIRDDRVNRIYKTVEKLNGLGIDINAEEVLKLVDLGSVGRPHVARVLVSKGKVKNIQEAFNRYLDNSSPAYVPHFKLTPAEAVKTIKKAGGIPVFAHPAVSAKDDIIPELVEAGLEGLEVYYSKHSNSQVKHYLALAKKYDLLATGGSDFHGALMRDVSLGDCTLPDSEFKKLEERHEKQAK
jgi:3',5'-nucleoside bisphosphate phosphatase